MIKKQDNFLKKITLPFLCPYLTYPQILSIRPFSLYRGNIGDLPEKFNCWILPPIQLKTLCFFFILACFSVFVNFFQSLFFPFPRQDSGSFDRFLASDARSAFFFRRLLHTFCVFLINW